MLYRADLAYRYDGTFEGFLCCVFESYASKEMPMAILPPDADQMVMFSLKTIHTDVKRAERVLRSIPERISPEVREFTYNAFLTCIENKELYMLKFLRMGFCIGAAVMDYLTDDTVNILTKAVRQLSGEAHLYLGFIRFSDYHGALVSVIEPKNFILPIIAPHFIDRFGDEKFMIYDTTHKVALIYENGRHEVMPLNALELPENTESELHFRALWRQFHEAIAVESRIKPCSQKNLLPGRYRNYMTEFQG